MSAIGNTIRSLRKERGWTQIHLAGLLEVTQSVVSDRERGAMGVSHSERKRYAAAFGMTLDEFDTLWRANKIEQTIGGDGIPVINRAPAGGIVDYEEYGVDSGQGFEYIDFGQLSKDQNLFALIVTGDSMSPTLEDGEYAVFKPMDREKSNGDFKDGSVCFVRFSREYKEQGCTIARVWPLDDGDLQLTKDNPDHKPRLVKREYVEQIAVAIERRSKLN